MKILKIQGRNIRSLYGHFLVNLDQPPFDQAGLFAITGVTGAGKSTLLDVICLALYGTCPRLDIHKRGTAFINDLSGNDPRTAVSRGVSEALAEILFESNDRQYRAIWKVGSSSKKNGGLLQKPQRELIDESAGKTIATKYQEFNSQIAKITGLEFSQFTRSVLLAQGDFASFLKAHADERATLLESITGLDIYTQVSIKAHQRWASVSETIKRLESQLSYIQPPDDDRIQTLDAQIAEARSGIQECQLKETAIQKHIAWYARHDELEKVFKAAREVYSLSEEKQVKADQQRILLVRTRKAVSIRPAIELMQKTVQHLESAQTAYRESLTQKQTCDVEHSEALKRLKRAIEQLDAEKKRQDLLIPKIESARVLDVKIQDASKNFTEKQSALTNIQRKLNAVQAKLEPLEKQDQQLAADLNLHREWLKSHQVFETLAAEWTHWSSLLKQFEKDAIRSNEGLAQEKRLETRLNQLKKENRRLTEASEAIAQQITDCDTELKQLTRQLEDHETQYPYERMQKTISIASDAAHDMASMIRLLRESENLSDQQIKMNAEQERCKQELNDLNGRRKSFANERNDIRIRLDEARNALEMIRDTLSCEQFRSKLEPGKPCMVCGATSHPYIEEVNAPGEQARIREQDRVTELDRQLHKTEDRLSQTDSQTIRIEETLNALNQRIGDADQSFKKIRDELKSTKAAFHQKINEVVEFQKIIQKYDDDDHETVLREIQSELESKRESAMQELTRQKDWATRIQQARNHRETLQTKDRKNRDTLTANKADIASDEAGLEQAAQRRRESLTQQDDILNQLAKAFDPISATWESACKANPPEFRTLYEKQVAEYKNYEARLSELTQEISELKPVLAEAVTNIKEFKTQHTRAAYEKDEAGKRLKDFMEQRKGFLDGKPVVDVETDLRNTIKTLEDALTRSRDAEKKTAVQFQAAESSLNHLASNLHIIEGDHASARETLKEALCRIGMDETEAISLIRKGDEYITLLEKEISDIDRETERSRENMRQRENDLNTFVNSPGKPEIPCEELKMTLERLTVYKKELTETLDMRNADKLDAQRQLEKAVALKNDLETTKEDGKWWQILNELIGHHSGVKFRKFAQQITLNHLIQLANQQLDILSPRYRLEQLGGDNLDLAVMDMDQASELRQISTLSGGEMFLTSLALALALSKLSGRQAQIRTLFIDEGFGLLDPDTLDTALAALEMIRTDGKTIGLISHVPTIQERIACQVKVIPKGAGRSVLEIRNSVF